MGEVFRARDTQLRRDVAIKILPRAFTSDPDRLARFEREAEILASLNHPNIAAIYGIETSGGTPALVMERVEGETLADRIARKPIPLDEALPIAKRIAESLEAAHEQRIVHRDLKPANTLIYPTGVQTGMMGRLGGTIQGHLGRIGRDGNALGTFGDPGQYRTLALSPDATRLAFERIDPEKPNVVNSWLFDFARAVTTRFTFDSGSDSSPVWSPDGSRIAFDSERQGGAYDLYEKASLDRLCVGRNGKL